jgi:hypothetical protein
MNAGEERETSAVPDRQPSARTLRAGFWLSCVSLTIGWTFLVSFPTLRMTSSQTMPLVLAGGASSIAALVLCAIGKGRLFLRLAGFVVGGSSLAMWAVLLYFNAIFSGQFVR